MANIQLLTWTQRLPAIYAEYKLDYDITIHPSISIGKLLKSTNTTCTKCFVNCATGERSVDLYFNDIHKDSNKCLLNTISFMEKHSLKGSIRFDKHYGLFKLNDIKRYISDRLSIKTLRQLVMRSNDIVVVRILYIWYLLLEDTNHMTDEIASLLHQRLDINDIYTWFNNLFDKIIELGTLRSYLQQSHILNMLIVKISQSDIMLRTYLDPLNKMAKTIDIERSQYAKDISNEISIVPIIPDLQKLIAGYLV